jgi:hypothetical protein
MTAALMASTGLNAAENGASDRCLLAHLTSVSIHVLLTSAGVGYVS